MPLRERPREFKLIFPDINHNNMDDIDFYHRRFPTVKLTVKFVDLKQEMLHFK